MRTVLPLLALLAITACSTPAPLPPAPPAPPLVVAPPKPVPVQEAAWTEKALTPGDWVYRKDDRGSLALFGPPGSEALLLLRCEVSRRTLYMSAAGQFGTGVAGSLTIRTSSTMRKLAAANTGGDGRYVAVELTPRDTILDAMAFSRGRFAVQGSGPTVVVPPWPEVSRVIEDCR